MSNPIIQKQCRCCKENKPIIKFYKRNDIKNGGYRTECKNCTKTIVKNYRHGDNGIKTRNKYQQGFHGRTIRAKSQRCFYVHHRQEIIVFARNKRLQFPEREKAMSVVNMAVRAGKIPRANTQKCHYCPQQARQYHHYLGYQPQNYLNVLPVCRSCHKFIHISLCKKII